MPKSYTEVKQSIFMKGTAWWAFNFINNWAATMYNQIYPEVRREIDHWQSLAIKLVQELDGEGDKHAADLDHCEERTQAFAEEVVGAWWALAWRLVAKFNNGYVITGERPQDQGMPGYPEWWLRAVGYDKWPGPTFSYPGYGEEEASSSSSWRWWGSSAALVGLGAGGAVVWSRRTASKH